jgi:hypothetical protein
MSRDNIMKKLSADMEGWVDASAAFGLEVYSVPIQR